MVRKSYAKVNIFLKVVGIRNNYHLLNSRFMRVKSLYDTIELKKGSFDIIGDFGCELEKNTIYKAYLELIKIKPQIKKYLKDYKIEVDKKIPYFAGLGGGSSNAATFLNMINEYFELGFSKNELANIGLKVGADVPFFVYEYDSANVSGIGEIVEKFDEDSLNLEIFTPDIRCSTAEIFKKYKELYIDEITNEKLKDKKLQLTKSLMQKSSIEILNELDIFSANDLYKPALLLNPNLLPPDINSQSLILNSKYYFSGSGSSFFKN